MHVSADASYSLSVSGDAKSDFSKLITSEKETFSDKKGIKY